MIASLMILIAGWPLAALMDRGVRESSANLRLAEAYLLGVGLAAAVLSFDSGVGIRWSAMTTILPLVIVAVIAAGVSRRALIPRRFGRVGAASLIDVLSIALGVGYVRFATVGPSPENDFVEIWGLKAREFAFAHAVDWHFLEQPFNRFSHVDYPILLPLLFDFHDVVAGGWPGRWLGVVNVCFGAATLLLLRGFLADEPSTLFRRAIATVALFSAAFSPWLGLAECAMVAYGTAALLFLRRGIRSGVNADFARGAIYLGLAANVKNEGLTLIVAAACALIVAGPWRSVVRLWPAMVMVIPWQFARFIHHLQTDLIAAGVLERTRERLVHFGPMVRAIALDSPGRPLFWIGVATALLAGAGDLRRRERFLVAAIVIQFAFFIAAYVATPHDVAWHVRWSWERLVSQLAPSMAFLAMALIMRRVASSSGDDGKLPVISNE